MFTGAGGGSQSEYRHSGRFCGLTVVYQLAYQRDLLLAEVWPGRLPYPDICPGVTFYSAGGGLGLPCPG
ncbi:hypothetical protein BML2531_09250 [Providencia rettgeri]|nr:hypothetical protein BML2531_09250 [Providencia rettgeri]